MCEFKALLIRGETRTELMDDVVTAKVDASGAVVLVDVVNRQRTVEHAAIASADLMRREILLVEREGAPLRC